MIEKLEPSNNNEPPSELVEKVYGYLAAIVVAVQNIYEQRDSVANMKEVLEQIASTLSSQDVKSLNISHMDTVLDRLNKLIDGTNTPDDDYDLVESAQFAIKELKSQW